MSRYAKNFYNTRGWFYGNGVNLFSFFFIITAASESCVATVVNGYRETKGVGISARDEAVLKAEHRQKIQLKVKEDVL